MLMSRSIFLLIVVSLVGTRCSGPQTSPPKKVQLPFPGKVEAKNYFPGQIPGRQIQLLPGYKVETEAGMEGPHGRIWNDSGLTIRFSITGRPYGYIESPRLWTIDQIVNGHHFFFSFNADQSMDVWIPDLGTQFDARIRNQQDLAELLLMVMTYQRSTAASTADKQPGDQNRARDP
jgi:hypothetical protein